MKQVAIIALLCLVSVGLAGGQKPASVSEPVTAPIPVSYGLVIDNSGSYRTLLERVIKLVSAIVDENKPGDEAFLVTFVDTPKIVLRQDVTESKDDLRDSAENMFIEGGLTSILDAVKYSAEHLTQNAKGGADRSRVLVLVTDGDERQSTAKIDEVLKALKAANVRVFVIAIAEEKVYTKLIDRLSKETGGMKYTPKTRDEMTAAVKSLSTAIRTK